MKKSFSVSFLFGLLNLFIAGSLCSQSGWIQLNSGITSTLVTMSIVDSLNIYVVGFGPGKILKTTNGGVNWTILSGINFNLHSVDFINKDTGFVGGENNGLFKTTNGGNSWTVHYFTLVRLGIIKLLNSSTYIVIGHDSYYHYYQLRTTDCGQSWIQTSLGNDNISDIYFINSTTGFLSGYHRVYKTNNGGVNWSIISTNNNNNNLLYNFIDSNVGFMWSDIGIQKTTNGGVNWTVLFQDPSNFYSGGFFINNYTGYASGYGKIIKTTNGGSIWYVQYTHSISLGLLEDRFINNNTGFVIGEGGTILKTTNGGEPLGIKPVNNIVPVEFNLHQNYPNPFNPVTKIKLEIPLSRGVDVPSTRGGRGVSVRLIVFDVLGREIVTLVNERLKPGTYEVEWVATNNPSGVYFYKLTADEFTETRRMVLIK